MVSVSGLYDTEPVGGPEQPTYVNALVTARMPEGMRNLAVACLRYSAQTYAYSLLVTGRYPSAEPVLHEREPKPEAAELVLGDAF